MIDVPNQVEQVTLIESNRVECTSSKKKKKKKKSETTRELKDRAPPRHYNPHKATNLSVH